jgi:hypothetical protein
VQQEWQEVFVPLYSAASAVYSWVSVSSSGLIARVALKQTVEGKA